MGPRVGFSEASTPIYNAGKLNPHKPIFFMNLLLSIGEVDDFPSAVVGFHVNDGSVREDRVLVSGSVDSLDGAVRKPNFLRPVRIRNLSLTIVELQGFRAIGRRRMAGFRQGVEVHLCRVDDREDCQQIFTLFNTAQSAQL